MKQVSRYHPLLVTLHWLLAVLIIAALAIGFFVLAAMPNVDPQKIGVLRVHMAGGMLILALMVIRFAVRMWTSRPAAATTGYPLLDRIAPITHYGFYVLVLLMVGSGYTTAILRDSQQSFSVAQAPRYCPTFKIYPSFVAHGYIATVLAGLIVLHVFATLYHQFVMKDKLFRRMFFGRRVHSSSVPTE